MAELRKVVSVSLQPHVGDNVDIVLVRENTEGLYIGVEHYVRIGDDPRAAAESAAGRSRWWQQYG